MTRKIAAFLVALLFLSIITKPAFAESNSASYLCEIGVTFYKQGRYEEALTEFKKALLVEPNNKTAKKYINSIFGASAPGQETLTKETIVPKEQAAVPKETRVSQKVKPQLSREDAMEQTLSMTPGMGFPDEAELELMRREKIAEEEKTGKFKITGEAQLALGIAAPSDTIWKRSLFDLNERNWRMLSDAAYNRRFNTYDPRIYDSLDLFLDTNNKEGFDFHTNITVDPYSFTGKGPKTTVTSAYGDNAEIQLKYWSNMGYTVNETVYTSKLGNSFTLPEIKVRNNETDPFKASGAFTDAITGLPDTFSYPGMKIQREFQPFRELWVDYNQDPLSLRVFPIAYQDQINYQLDGLVSDDPLAITNHHIWWQDSMWLSNYQPGIYNSGTTPVDFTKGLWDNHLTFLSRDSDGTYLTALRGFSLGYQPQERTALTITAATPKNLWQDYTEVDNASSATRLKHLLLDNLSLGATFTTRTAFNNGVDNQNYVGGMDFGYELTEGVKAWAEVLRSQSYYDQSNETYKTKARGNAYYFSIAARYPRKSIMDLTYGYDDIKLEKGEVFLLKGRFFVSHMDDGFDSALSTYHHTRRDQFWSRHLTFRQPFDYYYAGLKYPGLKWDEIKAIRIGDGIDYGRDVIGFRAEAICDKKYENLFDVRNVHNVNGKYIENVARDELILYFGEKWTFKGLALYQNMHKTYGGIDPFIYNGQTGEYFRDWSSNPIDDGMNPTLKTGSLGAEYQFFDWLSANGIWEYTNDYTEGYGNFPRGVMNSSQMSDAYYEEGNKYRGALDYLYDQQLFPQPPYPFYNIYKCGLRVKPAEELDIYLDYTRNEFEMAGQIADTMNHVGLEVTYVPLKQLGFLLKYNFSRWKDLDRLRLGETSPLNHNNFFGEVRYMPSKYDEFIMQYGEGNVSPIGNITLDPFGGSLTTLDTQHIFRFYYRRKF